MAKVILTDQNFKRNAEIYKILANSKRLKILNNITKKELSVNKISEVTNVSQPNLSQHLAILRKNKLVTSRKVKNSIYYRIADPIIVANCKKLAEFCN